MALDLRTELTNNDAQAFVEKVFGSPDASVQMANIHQVIEQARTSSNPDLQKFAQQLNAALTGYAQGEKYEVDAELAARDGGWGGIFKEIMGEDGKFQMSDLKNLDFGKLIGEVFKSLFNNEAGGMEQKGTAAKAEANGAVNNALAFLDKAEAGGADVSKIRTLMGRDNANLKTVVGDIDGISPGTAKPPAAPAVAPGS